MAQIFACKSLKSMKKIIDVFSIVYPKYYHDLDSINTKVYLSPVVSCFKVFLFMILLSVFCGVMAHALDQARKTGIVTQRGNL